MFERWFFFRDRYSSYSSDWWCVVFFVSRTCEQYDKSTLPPMEPAGLVGGVEILRSFYGDEAFTLGFLIEPPKEWNVTRVIYWTGGTWSMQHATLKSSCFLVLDIQVWKPKDTPSKCNSSPLNTYLPKRKFHLPTIHFQWQAVNLRGWLDISLPQMAYKKPF